MSKSRFLRTVVVPILVGAIATGLVAWYIQNEEKRLSPTDLVPLVVAAKPVPAKAVLLPDMLIIKQIPRAYMLPNVATRTEDVLGKVTTVALSEGEPLFTNKVVTQDRGAGLSHHIPQGLRAVTIAVNEIIGVAAFPEPGDSVDVLATFSKEIAGYDRTLVILEGVKVLSVVRDVEARGGQFQRDLKGYTSLTLAVTPQQATTLVWSEEKGRLRVVLRPNDSTERVGSIESNAQTVTGYRPVTR